MTERQPKSGDSNEEINIDRPASLDADTVLPDWVYEVLEENDVAFEDIFGTLAEDTGKFCKGLNGRDLYRVTVFCLLQLLIARTNRRCHQLGKIIDQHKQWQIGYERGPAYNTYWNAVDNLVDAGIVERVNDGKKIKFGLPEGKDIAPAFQPDNPDNILDRITLDDPTPRDELEARIVPGLRQTVRPQIRSVSGYLAWLGNTWDLGLKALIVGVALTAVYVETPLFGAVGPTLAAGIFWGFISFGMTAMGVDILDQVRAGYQEANHC
ncbi:hypothetical protein CHINAEXTREME_14200 [Halobiforma lacisalsi AJ5]|uniref:Uncharacterized protein n=1 Tax=Natronobacterium lacisalsi AJ5 TaxID=358396 RepID=M0LIG7_NATLA|nr:hypothetical protein [Halobiforma lacisalsi]APW98861.1 hypothetical protein CHINAEXTREME_14200 [Halobiforma lacisalsi AJ5]EMA32224.1 hypothetical protein C445_11521 [Halobiforma lacisalsi AJ5]